MSNVTSDDLRDTMLEVTADVQETMREVMQELIEPTMMDDLTQMWASMPEKAKEQFKREKPAEYAALMDVISERR